MKTENLILAAILGFVLLRSKKGAKVGFASKQFRKYIPYLLDEGKTALGKWAYYSNKDKSFYIVPYDDGTKYRGYYTIIDGEKLKTAPYFDYGTMKFSHARIYLDQLKLYNGHFYKGYETVKDRVRTHFILAD